MLARCLGAARAQTLAPARYEVLVVDSASTDHTRALVRRAEAARRAVRLRYLYCERPGLARARNAGARAARAPVAAYIDDDAIAAPDLLERVLEVYAAHPRAGCVGGAIDPRLPPEPPSWCNEAFAAYFSAYHPADGVRRVTGLAEYPYGANLSFRKEALHRAGYFRTELGHVGRADGGGEEIDAQARIARLGYEIYTASRARVTHIVPASRMDWRRIERLARAAGANWAHYEREGYLPATPLGEELRRWFAAWRTARRTRAMSFERSQELFLRAKLAARLRKPRA